MKKILSFILAAVMLICVTAACTSCKKEYFAESEIRAALEELIPASAELNEIYFGRGLPTLEYEETEDYLSSEIKPAMYAPVTFDCKYQTEDELREATLAVFTEDYAETLFERAFSGLSVSYDNQSVSGTLYALYIETDGMLTKRTDMENEALPLGREYALDKMTVTRQKKTYVFVEIPTEVNGEESVTVKLKLVYTEKGWRLDSPTY